MGLSWRPKIYGPDDLRGGAFNIRPKKCKSSIINFQDEDDSEEDDEATAEKPKKDKKVKTDKKSKNRGQSQRSKRSNSRAPLHITSSGSSNSKF